jgi:hypothetical protein
VLPAASDRKYRPPPSSGKTEKVIRKRRNATEQERETINIRKNTKFKKIKQQKVLLAFQ